MIDTTLSSYDAVLAAIALSVGAGGVVSVVSSVSALLGLVGGGIPALGIVGYALFIDPPSNSTQ